MWETEGQTNRFVLSLSKDGGGRERSRPYPKSLRAMITRMISLVPSRI